MRSAFPRIVTRKGRALEYLADPRAVCNDESAIWCRRRHTGDNKHPDTEFHPPTVPSLIDMKTLEEVKNEYERQVEILLQNHPAELLMFKELWAAGEFRRAYVVVQEVTRNFRLVMSTDMDKADEEFFWMYMH